MRMSDVEVGMKLRTTNGATYPYDLITVTEITARGFKYSIREATPFIARDAMMIAKDGHEHFGYSDGTCPYEPILPWMDTPVKASPPAGEVSRGEYVCSNPACRTRWDHMPAFNRCPICREDTGHAWSVYRDAPINPENKTLTDGSPVTPDHKEIDPRTGMQKGYIVLSEEERRKGFLRPVRSSYVHVGKPAPKHPMRGLKPEEKERYKEFGYIMYEEYPSSRDPVAGKFWTKDELERIEKGCQGVTTMGRALAETYAAKPDYYSGTYCATCGAHFPVGENGEFVWSGTTERVGT